MSKANRAKRRCKQPQPQHIDMKPDELVALVERSRAVLSADDYAKLKAAMDTLLFLMVELQAKKASIERLRTMLFGPKTEKTSNVLGKNGTAGGTGSSGDGNNGGKPNAEVKRPGHGRNGASAYTGAKKVKIPHPSLHSGDCCPECIKGRVYPLSEPAVLVRITGMAPLGATLYERDRLRCNLCGEVFTAPSPEGVGEKKYDETATAMVGMFKYGTGLPFNRIEKLQQGLGIPLPAATQWDLVQEAALLLAPVFEELLRTAAQGEVLYNDDTTMKILQLSRELVAAAAGDNDTDERTGVFTSGIVSTRDGRQIALFFTGVKHAGENLADVLARRAASLPPPIQMCDALSRNTSGDFDAIVANCNAHARRKYVEVANDFPEECRFVLETLRQVYKNDAITKQRNMSAEERLRFHQAESGPLMDGLEQWMEEQFEQHKVEPNSGLGEAIGYMQKHWSKLTLFLHVAGAPLDNNICYAEGGIANIMPTSGLCRAVGIPTAVQALSPPY